jgi:hypothetical protein
MLLKHWVSWSEIAHPPALSQWLQARRCEERQARASALERTHVGEWTFGNVAVDRRDDEGAKIKRNEPIDVGSQKPHHLHHHPLGHP